MLNVMEAAVNTTDYRKIHGTGSLQITLDQEWAKHLGLKIGSFVKLELVGDEIRVKNATGAVESGQPKGRRG